MVRMTIRASQGGTDFGVVGFCKEKAATYVAFLKSLKHFKRERIVGIYSTLVQS